MARLLLVLSLVLAAAPLARAQTGARTEYEVRRSKLLTQFPAGLVLLHARSQPKALTEHGFKQDASFYYFTGLANQPAAILVLDGVQGESRLFVPPPPESFGASVQDVSLPPGEDSASAYGFTSVQPWEELVPYLRSRIADGVDEWHLETSRRPEMPGNPAGLWPLAGDKTLWRRSLEEAFPEANITSAKATEAIRTLRWVKSEAEIEISRQVAEVTSRALMEGIRAVRPGASQRESEAAVVRGCIAFGGQGPGFWPWTMSGPNSHVEALVRAFYDYEHLDRAMQDGELVRMDVGCDVHHYEGDVGRTVPVSGRFRSGQREAWNLLITAYRGGLSAIRDGVSRAEIARAARTAVREAESPLETETGRAAAEAMLESADDLWHVHGVGIEGGEERVDPLRAGSVLAFEPMVTVGDDAFYLEDMILVTEDGYEILSTGLPYTAEEIEAFMGR